MDPKAMVQSWPGKGRSPVPPQGNLTQDGGSPSGAELGGPASPSPISQPRQPKGSVFARHQCAIAFTLGRNGSPRGNSPWLLPMDHNRVGPAQAQPSHTPWLVPLGCHVQRRISEVPFLLCDLSAL